MKAIAIAACVVATMAATAADSAWSAAGKLCVGNKHACYSTLQAAMTPPTTATRS